MSFIDVNVKVVKIIENGRRKRFKEAYMVEADSFTEAEAKITKEMLPYHEKESFTVSAVKKSNISWLIPSSNSQDNHWFKVKCEFVVLDEKTGVKKRTCQYALVQAEEIRVALDYFEKYMKGGTESYTVLSVQETKILDVYLN